MTLNHHVVVGSLTRPAPQFAAANGVGVCLCRFDDQDGQLEIVGAPLRLEDSTWVVAENGNDRAYVVTDWDGGAQSAIASIKIDRNAEHLSLLSIQPAGGHEGCHASISQDGSTIFVANYGGKRAVGRSAGLAVFPVKDGLLAPATVMFEHHGRGPNPQRQEAPHAHCVVPSPDDKFLFVVDLGIDRIVAYSLSGEVPERREDLDVALPAGSGPRHLVFSSEGTGAFLVSELVAAVTVLAYEPTTGVMKVTTRVPLALPTGEPIQPAGIVVHPDRRHVLVSARLSDEIIVLTLDDERGNPRITGRFPSGGLTPRDLVISPSGRHLLVANQDSSRITVWALEDGHPLASPRCELEIGTPMSIAFL